MVLKVKVAQSCLTLCNRMDYTVHGILQARKLEWVAFPLTRGSFQSRDQTQVSRIFHLQFRRPQFDSWVRKVRWRRDRLPIPVFLGFPCSSTGKESTWNAGDLGSIPGLERSPGEGKCYPLQYSGLENSMYYIVHGVRKSWTWLSNFHFSLSKSLKTFKEHFSEYDSDNSYKFELETTLSLSRTNISKLEILLQHSGQIKSQI